MAQNKRQSRLSLLCGSIKPLNTLERVAAEIASAISSYDRCRTLGRVYTAVIAGWTNCSTRRTLRRDERENPWLWLRLRISRLRVFWPTLPSLLCHYLLLAPCTHPPGRVRNLPCCRGRGCFFFFSSALLTCRGATFAAWSGC